MITHRFISLLPVQMIDFKKAPWSIRWWQFTGLTLALLATVALAWVLARSPATPRSHADWQAPYVAPSLPEVAIFPPVAPDFPSL